ncbi:MAG: FAD-dependent oxidoreductase [archaeon]
MSALALAKERKTVLLLEKTSLLGGNCRSYNIAGFQVDTGVHAITSLKKGPLVELMNKYFDIVPRFLPHGHYYVRSENKLLRFPSTLQSLARFNMFSKKDRLIIARSFIDATKNHTFDEKELDKSVYDFIKKYDFSQSALKFIDTVCYFLSGKSMEETPVWRILSGGGTTDELSRGIKKKISGIVGIVKNNNISGHGYPAGGIRSITNAILMSIPIGRVTINTDEAATKIRKKGNAFLTTTKKGKYRSGIVIFTAEVKTLPSLIENKLPQDFKDSLLNLKQSKALTLWLGLKQKRKEFDYIGSEVFSNSDTPYWAMPVSNYDPQFAPPGTQLIGFTSALTGGRTEKEQSELLLDTIKGLFPGIEKGIIMKHIQVTTPEKAAITVGARFPGPRTPISGLYLAGTDTDTRSMGVTRAAHSVEEMLKELKKDKVI